MASKLPKVLSIAGAATTALPIAIAVVAGNYGYSLKSNIPLAYTSLPIIAWIGVAAIVAGFILRRKDSEQAKAKTVPLA